MTEQPHPHDAAACRCAYQRCASVGVMDTLRAMQWPIGGHDSHAQHSTAMASVHAQCAVSATEKGKALNGLERKTLGFIRVYKYLAARHA